MTTFRYTAFDAQGELRAGEIEADHPRAARALLRERGLLSRELTARDAPRGASLFARRASAMHLALFSRQFATLLNAGLPIERALAALLEQAEDGAQRDIVGELREQVLAGHALAAAMALQPRVFPRHYAAVARAGEEAGALPAVMERLADYLERGQRLRNKVGMALIYPLLVGGVALLVIGILLTYVVPQVVAVFAHSRQSLPWLTQALIASSDFLRASWWLWLVALFAGAALSRQLLKLDAMRLRWHRWLLRLPLLGRLRVGIASARFANTLAALVGSGVPALDALRHAGAALDDLVFRQAVEAATARVREGMSISRALRAGGVFPAMLPHLVASGEASGELARVLTQAALQQEQDVETRLSTLTALLEPLLILIMGGIVLVIVLATLQPLIEMNRLIT